MSNEISKYLLAASILGILHGSIPNHWIPFALLSKKEIWSSKKLLFITFTSASLHNLSTTILGFFSYTIGSITFEKIETLEKIVPTTLFIILGIFFLLIKKNNKRNNFIIKENLNPKIVVFMLFISMLFSPCLEIQSIYLSINKQNLKTFLLISFSYSFLSSLSIISFTYIGYKGIKILNYNLIEKYEKKIIGLIFILLGISNIAN